MTYLAPCFTYKSNSLNIDTQAVNTITKKQNSTPYYIYSATQIRANITGLQSALNSILPSTAYTICYACKALNNIAVMALIAKTGCGADIVSSGELTRAQKAAVDPAKIVFSGVGKTDKEIAHALSANIRQINVESEAELLLIEAVATSLNVSAPIVFRLNPDVKAGAHEKISTGQKENKFGLNAQTILRLYDYAAKSAALNPRGISLHIGSQLIDMGPFDTAYSIAATFIGALRAAGHSPDTIDLGGGIGIIYDDEDQPDLSHYAQIVKKHIVPLGLHMIFEPGRMIVGNAGLLVTKILYIKEAEQKRFVIIDAGMNDLMRPALYDSPHPIIPIENSADDTAMASFDVVGPVCESADVFAKNIMLPASIKAGDYLALSGAGAYGATMSSNYNARDLAAEILVDGEKCHVIRRAIGVDDYLSFECMAE
jgi:diaminopimelate decarboxylase